MNRKKQRCPYCGKRMSYFSAFFSRRKAEYVCTRCGKESRVVINKVIIPVFIIAAVISLAVIGVWFFMKWLSNPLGIALVAAPLLIFLLISPKFVQLEPLKKYKKSMEAKKAGIEFSDSLIAPEAGDDMDYAAEGEFKINADLFNQIKAERTAPKGVKPGQEILSDSEKIETPEIPGASKPAKAENNYVPVINPVSENHASTSSEPLKKLHAEGTRVVRPRHYVEERVPQPEAEGLEEEVREYKKPDTNKYSGNRRF